MATSQEIDAFLAGVERRAFKQALFTIQDHHSALDAVQNAMLKLVERYHDKPAEELPLLFQRILQNTIHDHFRRSKVREFWVRLVSPLRGKDDENGETLESIAAASEATHQPSPEKEASSNQHLAAIEQAISELPPRQREAFLLRYDESEAVMDTQLPLRASGCRKKEQEASETPARNLRNLASEIGVGHFTIRAQRQHYGVRAGFAGLVTRRGQSHQKSIDLQAGYVHSASLSSYGAVPKEPCLVTGKSWMWPKPRK